jgi:DNA-binding transcriptional MerR regulator
MAVMRITEAASALGMSPRMLRYRERLGLVPGVRTPGGQTQGGPTVSTAHRRYTDDDLDTIRFAMSVEKQYGVSPAALAFALRTLADPAVGQVVRELAERLGRLPTPAARANEIDKERALRWLGRSGVLPPPRRVRGR